MGTYEHNLQTEWIQVTVHKAWLEWARFSHHDHHCTYEHNLQTEWIRVTVHRAWLEWARISHHDQQRVHKSTTYTLSVSESPFTGHGWNEQGFHIMIISVYMYIWAQLTSWVNPSHRPQGMVGMSKDFTSWSAACTHEHNLLSKIFRVTVHRAWLEWARFSHYNHQSVCTYERNLPSE